MKGGRYYGSWPGLGTESVIDGDLKATTDYRNVPAEIIAKRLADRSIPARVPDLTIALVGVMT